MAFATECTFCHLILRGVPDQRLGSSFECPRCHNCFTLAPTTNPLAQTLPTTELVVKPSASRPAVLAGHRQAEHPRPDAHGHPGKPVTLPPHREAAAEVEPFPIDPGRAVPDRS